MPNDKPSNESLHIFYEAFSELYRLAPGSDTSTCHALDIVKKYRKPGQVLDIGCGVGAQTFAIAEHSDAFITALDNYQPYLQTLEKQAWKKGLAQRIKPVLGSMFELELAFAPNTFDVIWAEGSAYILGFDQALVAWAPLLKMHGVIAVTEISWLTDAPSSPTKNFWEQAYPRIRSIQKNRDLAKMLGYRYLDHFVLPPTDWTEGYYKPLSARVSVLQEKYSGNPDALLILQAIEEEIDFYHAFGDEYGYVFYILQKTLEASVVDETA
jgi:ubiquinone/menaquinone biosynthesis C-methylase UbiE